MRQSKWSLLLLLLLPLAAQTAQLWQRRPQERPAQRRHPTPSNPPLITVALVAAAYVPRGVLAMPTAASITKTCYFCGYISRTKRDIKKFYLIFLFYFAEFSMNPSAD